MINEVVNLKIRDLPAAERPYEKLEAYGPENLSNAELLAIIIKTGNRNETSVSLAQRVLMQDMGKEGLTFLNHISLDELKCISGIGRVKAIQIKAMTELSRRISSTFNIDKRMIVKTPTDVTAMFMQELRHESREIFRILLLNTKNHVLRSVDISIGSLNSSIVHPREVFKEAIKASCSAVILIHNHPSGDPQPSNEDIETTKRLVNSGNVLGINVLDHIIIGDGKYVSLKEQGLL